MIFSRLQPFCVYCHLHNKQTSFSFPFSKLPSRRAPFSRPTYQSSFSRSRPIRARREFYRPIKSLVSSSILGGGVGSWRRGRTEARGVRGWNQSVGSARNQPWRPALELIERGAAEQQAESGNTTFILKSRRRQWTFSFLQIKSLCCE